MTSKQERRAYLQRTKGKSPEAFHPKIDNLSLWIDWKSLKGVGRGPGMNGNDQGEGRGVEETRK